MKLLLLPDGSLKAKLEQEQVHWEFKPLLDIEVLGPEPFNRARILYEDEAGGDIRSIPCAASEFPALEPYAAELLAWKEDPLAHEQPVMPILHKEDGKACFYPEAGNNNRGYKLRSLHVLTRVPSRSG